MCGLKYLENQGDLWAFLLFADRVLFMVPLIVVFLIGRGSDSLWPYVLGVGLTIALIGTFPMRLGMSVGADYLISCHSGNYGQTSNPAAGDPSDPA